LLASLHHDDRLGEQEDDRAGDDARLVQTVGAAQQALGDVVVQAAKVAGAGVLAVAVGRLFVGRQLFLLVALAVPVNNIQRLHHEHLVGRAGALHAPRRAVGLHRRAAHHRPLLPAVRADGSALAGVVDDVALHRLASRQQGAIIARNCTTSLVGKRNASNLLDSVLLLTVDLRTSP